MFKNITDVESPGEFILECAMSDYNKFKTHKRGPDAIDYMYDGVKFNDKRKDKLKFISWWTFNQVEAHAGKLYSNLELGDRPIANYFMR